MEEIKQRLPDRARDLRLNLGVITSSTALSPAQAWGIAVASAHTTRNADLVSSVEAASNLDAAQLQAGGPILAGLVDNWLSDLERILGTVKDAEIDPRFVEGVLVEVHRS